MAEKYSEKENSDEPQEEVAKELPQKEKAEPLPEGRARCSKCKTELGLGGWCYNCKMNM